MNDSLKKQLEFVQTIEGWCSSSKAEAIAESVIKYKPRTCVEIGVYGGRSLIACALALREVGEGGKIWGVDPWTLSAALEQSNNPEHNDWWTNIVNLKLIRDQAFAALDKLDIWGNAGIVVGKSLEAAQFFDAIDWFHLDGSHFEEIAHADIMAWVPKVKSGGVIWFDDADWPSTQKALAALKEMADLALEVRHQGFSLAQMFIKR